MMRLSKKLKKTLTWNAFATACSSRVYYLATGSIGVVPVVVVVNFGVSRRLLHPREVLGGEEMNGLKEAAEKIRAERNKKWCDSWDEWERVAFIDHIIAKLKRANNCPAELRECLIDAYNYAMALRRHISNSEEELKIIDHLVIKLEQIWEEPCFVMRYNHLDVALSRAVELKRRLLGGGK